MKPGDAPAPTFAASSQANRPTGRIMNTAHTGALTFSNAVPEPSTWAMLMVGFGGLGFAAFRRGRRVRALVA